MPGWSICDVLPAAATLLGAPQATDAFGLADYVGEVRRVVVVLIDGMGLHLLPELASDAPLLASVLGGATGRLDELVCTFPSTTPTSLASLGTGAAPGQHGLLGFTVNIPDTDRVLTHIFWRDDPPPAQWQPIPTWFERLRRAGVDARAVLPAPFIGSGLTESAYRGAQFCPAGRDDDYAAVVAEQISAATGLVYAYTSALDTAAHLFGVELGGVARRGGLCRRAVDQAARRVTRRRRAVSHRRPRRRERRGADRPRRRPAAVGRRAGGRRRAAGPLSAYRAGRSTRRRRHLD